MEVLYTGTTLQNVRKRDDSYDRVVHETRQETRHHDSCYVIHYITVRHSESYLDTTDITASRPPVGPYSYVSVDHAASRRYGRCQTRKLEAILLEDRGDEGACVCN